MLHNWLWSRGRVRTLGHADLHGSVILGLDDAVGGRALAWDVQVDEFSACSIVVSELLPHAILYLQLRHTFVLHFEFMGGTEGCVV
jgi:hypothetical protein